MKDDQVRPGWRGFMLMFLCLGVCPLARGVLPCPIVTFEDQAVRDRFLDLAPHCRPLLERGSCSAVALMEALFAGKEMPGVPIETIATFYQAASRVRAIRRKQSLTKKDVQELINGSAFIYGGTPIHDKWALAASVPTNEPYMEWIQWYLGVNVVSFFQWGIPFPLLLQIAREAPNPISMTALSQAITVDKSVMGLPWAVRRLEEAATRNDRAFMRKIGEALTMATVPKKLRAEALDFFLCMFHPWLNGLTLGAQAALIREGGLKVSEKALRNRRSRLGLPKLDLIGDVEIPQELQPWLKWTQELLKRGPGAK